MILLRGDEYLCARWEASLKCQLKIRTWNGYLGETGLDGRIILKRVLKNRVGLNCVPLVRADGQWLVVSSRNEPRYMVESFHCSFFESVSKTAGQIEILAAFFVDLMTSLKRYTHKTKKLYRKSRLTNKWPFTIALHEMVSWVLTTHRWTSCT